MPRTRHSHTVAADRLPVTLTTGALSARFVRASRRHKARRERLNQEKERIEAELERIGYGPGWIDKLVLPIAKALASRLDRDHDILGPFGICAETAIHLYRKGIPEDQRYEVDDNCRSITFVPGDLDKGELFIRDHKRNTGNFRPGTLGEMNGMNHPSISIPPEANIDWFLQHVS